MPFPRLDGMVNGKADYGRRKDCARSFYEGGMAMEDKRKVLERRGEQEEDDEDEDKMTRWTMLGVGRG